MNSDPSGYKLSLTNFNFQMTLNGVSMTGTYARAAESAQ